MTPSVPDTALLAAELHSVVLRLRRRLRSQGPVSELSEAQRGVLRQLRRVQALTITELARSEGIRSQSMSTIVHSLEALQLVTRSSDPSDGRQSLIRLTAAGHSLMTTSLEARAHWLHQGIVAQLSPTEQSTLEQALPLLERLLES